ncbi:MAG: hypothetical protein IT282_13350 [Bacteroidetes bacterium]|nr:hypothetical protein [Bacteroidota bacterium]
MAKTQTFADKAAKAALARGSKCPKCGEILQPILMVTSERSPAKGTWKFNERRVSVCKCNEKQVYS